MGNKATSELATVSEAKGRHLEKQTICITTYPSGSRSSKLLQGDLTQTRYVFTANIRTCDRAEVLCMFCEIPSDCSVHIVHVVKQFSILAH